MPIPLQRRVAGGKRPASIVPPDARHVVGELQLARDRDEIARLASLGLVTVARRAAFFVVRKGVVQGWAGCIADGPTEAGFTPEALRNLWIPITSDSVFRAARERGSSFLGPLSDSTADTILGAALGSRPSEIVLTPILVRSHVVAFIYGDGFRDAGSALARSGEIATAAAEAFARYLADGRGTR